MLDSWNKLTFDAILTVVEQITAKKLSNLVIQRNSYINRVYELSIKNSDEKLIVKFYRPDRWTKEMILEEHRFLFKLAEAELSVITPLVFNNDTLFEFSNIYFTVFPKMGGRAIDELTKERWIETGRLLGRMHLIGETISDSERVVWTPEEATNISLDYLFENGFIPEDYIEPLERVMDFFMLKANALFEQERLFVIHGDCHLGNLIHRPGEGMYIVDFDDMCVGPAIQDLWMLLPGTAEECEQEISWFAEGYEVFRSFNYRSLDLIPMLKVMRIIHFASWCAMQSDDAHFEQHFPDWGTNQYWNQIIREIQENVYSEEE